MRILGMPLSRFAQGLPAAGDYIQLGNETVQGFFLARILGDAQLALHTKPLHRGGFVLSGQALALIASRYHVHTRASMKALSLFN
jgi:hypothetical protein